MKKLIMKGTVISVLTALFLSSCNLLEGDFSGEVHTTFIISESSNAGNINYNSVSTVKATDDKDIRDNLDKVKNWSVEEISYQIKNFQGDPDVTFTGSIGFSKKSASSPGIILGVTGINLSSLNNGQKTVVALSSSDLATMASWMDSDHEMKVYFQGVLSQGPVSFDMVVYAKIKITAGLL